MKILHTSDWHVGKVLKGRDRHDEQVAVLRSIAATARDENVDVVLVAGDLFETAAPAAKAQGLVMRTLLALREDGRHVVVIAGNHDNQALLDAVYRPVLGELGLHVLGTPKRPDSGGLMTLRTRTGELINVAALPFLSHRYAVRAAEVLPFRGADQPRRHRRRQAGRPGPAQGTGRTSGPAGPHRPRGSWPAVGPADPGRGPGPRPADRRGRRSHHRTQETTRRRRATRSGRRARARCAARQDANGDIPHGTRETPRADRPAETTGARTRGKASRREDAGRKTTSSRTGS